MLDPTLNICKGLKDNKIKTMAASALHMPISCMCYEIQETQKRLLPNAAAPAVIQNSMFASGLSSLQDAESRVLLKVQRFRGVFSLFKLDTHTKGSC